MKRLVLLLALAGCHSPTAPVRDDGRCTLTAVVVWSDVTARISSCYNPCPPDVTDFARTHGLIVTAGCAP